VREHSFLSEVGLIGAIALLALAANAILNDRLPSAWTLATAVFGTENGLARIPPDGWITDAIEASAQARGS